MRQRAIQFSREWRGVGDERAEAQTFWNEFFVVFGKKRRLLAEHKSVGQDLGKAQSQAFQYIAALASSNREDEIPRYVIVSDFARLVLYDLEAEVARTSERNRAYGC